MPGRTREVSAATLASLPEIKPHDAASVSSENVSPKNVSHHKFSLTARSYIRVAYICRIGAPQRSDKTCHAHAPHQTASLFHYIVGGRDQCRGAHRWGVPSRA